jgi:hypothetical protein
MFKINFKLPRRVDIISTMQKDLITNDFAHKVQKEVIDDVIKPLIASGVSPVDGYEKRRFTKYKNPKSYPAKKKPKTPTNLFLSGLMLSYYQAKKITGNILRVGIQSEAPQDVKDRADANNVGTKTADGKEAIPARRFIPLKGETFRISVLRKIKKLYADQIARILSTKK